MWTANVQRDSLKRDACLPVHFAEQRPDPNVSTSAASFDTGYEVLANYRSRKLALSTGEFAAWPLSGI